MGESKRQIIAVCHSLSRPSDMVSETPHRLFVKILKIGQYLGLSRFYWDDRTCRLVYNQNELHLCREKIHLFVLILYNLFIVLRGYQVVASENVGTKQKISVSYSVVVFVLLTAHQTLCIIKGPEFCALVNGLMLYTKRAPAVEGKNGKAKPRPVENEDEFRRLKRFLWTRICMSLFAGGTNCLTAVMKPRRPVFITSLLSGPQLPAWMRILGSAFHVYIYVAQYYYLLLVISTTMYSCYGVLPAIKKLDAQGSKWMEYRVLYVLQAYYNAVFQHWMSCQVLLDTFGIIVNIYLAVILRSLRGLIVTFLASISAGWSLTEYSSLHEESSALLNKWVRHHPGRPEWFGKFHRSCRPINVNNGKTFYVDRALLLTLATIIIDKTTSLLVLHQN